MKLKKLKSSYFKPLWVTVLALITATLLGSCSKTEKYALRESFLNPPDSSRVHLWWHWMNGNISKEGITKDLEYMKAVGVGGLQQFDLDQYIPKGSIDHNSQEWHALMQHTLAEADRLGLDFGFNQCSGWSNSGGVWITPEESMKTVVFSETQITGGKEVFQKLKQPESKHNFYQDIKVFAFPTLKPELTGKLGFRIDNWKRKSVSYMHENDVFYRFPRDIRNVSSDNVISVDSILDLSSFMNNEGELQWDAPSGNWTVIRFGYTTTGMANHPASKGAEGLECDKLNRKGLNKHWNSFVKKVIENQEAIGSNALTNVLVDSYEVAQQNWTEGFDVEFLKRRNYNVFKWFVCLTGRVVEDLDRSERFLWDYRRTIADLMNDNYFNYYAELCEKENLSFTNEAYGSGYFDHFDAARSAHIPMSEFWIDDAGWAKMFWWSNKLASSAAHIDGKPIVAAESFTSSSSYDRWSTSPSKLKQLGDLMYTKGVNRFVIHGSVHQPFADNVIPGMTMGPWGMHLGRNNTWTKHAGSWFNYMARCQYLLQQGQFVADLLYIYSADTPNTADLRNKMRPTPPAGYDYDVTNFRVLKELKVENGTVVAPSGIQYRMIIVPYQFFMEPYYKQDAPNNKPLMRLETLNELKRLANEGAIILAEKPIGTWGLAGYPENNNKVIQLADALWDSGKIRTLDKLAETMQEIGLQPDFESPENDEVAYIHKKINDSDFYFVSNQSSEAKTLNLKFRVRGKQPEIWLPMTGKTAPAKNWRLLEDGRTEVILNMTGAEAVFVVFNEKTDKKLVSKPPDEFEKLVNIDCPWEVSFGKWGPKEAVIFDELISWDKHNNQDIKYFSGEVIYKNAFEISKEIANDKNEIYVDLGQVAVLARVKLNGMDLGTVWHPPFRVAIREAVKPGKNDLEIMVVNQLANRIIGDAKYPTDAPLNTERPYGRWRWQGSYKKLPDWVVNGTENVGKRKTFATFELWNEKDKLLTSGLLGPVQVLMKK